MVLDISAGGILWGEAQSSSMGKVLKRGHRPQVVRATSPSGAGYVPKWCGLCPQVVRALSLTKLRTERVEDDGVAEDDVGCVGRWAVVMLLVAVLI